MCLSLKQKISDAFFTCDTEIKTFIITEINTKIANELSSRVSEINDKSTAEISKIKNEIYSNFTVEIKSHDNAISSEIVQCHHK